MIESKLFAEKEIIADKMEQDFLNLYFGSNEDIQTFAKKLLLDNEKDAAKELNKAITVLGESFNPIKLITQIEDEFRLGYDTEQIKEKEKWDVEAVRFENKIAVVVIFIGIILFTIFG